MGRLGAVPILLRRIASELFDRHDVEVLRPFRLQRGRIIAAAQDLHKAVELGQLKVSGTAGRGAILVLVDADDDCPAQLGPALLAKVSRPGMWVSVVIAKREYEAWFLAAAHSLRRHSRVSGDATTPDDPESIRGAKEYLRDRVLAERVYSPGVDQPRLTAVMDLAEARASRSFDKLCRDLHKILEAHPPAD